ncbi:hypothetical protein HHI36_013512, partial [Cryptolaemus montrouzieri]
IKLEKKPLQDLQKNLITEPKREKRELTLTYSQEVISSGKAGCTWYPNEVSNRIVVLKKIKDNQQQ